MSDEVESMVYLNEVPWHGLGEKITKAKTVKEMLTIPKAKQDYCRNKPCDYDGKKDPIKEAFALQRSSDKAILDVVGPAYVPVQNFEGFEFFNEYVEAGNATMDTMGSLRGGKYVWGLADLKSGFKLSGKDEVKGYLLVAVPHQQGKSFVIKITTIRVVCMNTLMLALRKGGNEFRMVHRRAFTKEVMEEAKTTLGIARDQVKEFGETAVHLKKMKVSKDKAFEIFAQVYSPGDKFKLDDAPEKVKRVSLDALRGGENLV